MAVQSDGKVLLAGRAESGSASGNDFAIARFNGNGTLDSSFGAGGVVMLDMGSDSDSVNAIAVQGDGKIVVAGETTRSATSTDFALARLNSNGSLDATFGSGGTVVTDLSGDTDQLNAMKIAADGSIVVGGWSYVDGFPQFTLARYSNLGAMMGNASASFAMGYSQAQSIALASDGSVYAGGMLYDFSTGQRDFGVAHFMAGGAVDSSFGVGGFAQIDLGGESECANAVAVQSDGRILLAGKYHNSLDSRDDFAVARLMAHRLSQGRRPCSAETGAYCQARKRLREYQARRQPEPDGRYN